jgi:hypothetical protein
MPSKAERLKAALGKARKVADGAQASYLKGRGPPRRTHRSRTRPSRP